MTEHNKNSLGSILDLGCGTGLFGKEIRSFCNKLVGVDISKKMLEEDIGMDIVASHMHEIIDLFDECLGKVTNDQILQSIFSDFCVGK